MTAPVILALEQADAREKNFWKRTIVENTLGPGDFERAREILLKHNALENGIGRARTYAEKARLALAEAPDGPLRALLDEVTLFAVTRQH